MSKIVSKPFPQRPKKVKKKSERAKMCRNMFTQLKNTRKRLKIAERVQDGFTKISQKLAKNPANALNRALFTDFN